MFSRKSAWTFLCLFLWGSSSAAGQAWVSVRADQPAEKLGVKNMPATKVGLAEIRADMFDAWDRNLIEVRYIALDATRGNLLIENLQDRTMLVTLPDAFAATPVLGQLGGGQFGGGQIGGGQVGGGAQGGGAQNVGGNAQGGNQGGFNAGAQGFGNGAGQQGGFMRIPPGKTMRRSAVTVCLDHGLADPKPLMRYRVVPLDQVSDDPVVTQLCARLGDDVLDPNAIQAAVWNRANGIAWKDLAAMKTHQSRYRPVQTRFSPKQLTRAKLMIDGLVMTHGLSGQDASQESESLETDASAHSARSATETIQCIFKPSCDGD